MEYNASLLESNVTLQQIASALNLNITNATNVSDVSEKVFDIYDDYRAKEREQLQVYRLVAYVLGTLIILSNLTVVISSGLILKKGQQPKSTYLLLGNVSLADTIIGISIILGNLTDNAVSSNLLCIFQIGMVVCPTTVSIFSVGLIAIDRYIYILHGLYYQRWINATRVRISIVIIWLLGIFIASLPAMGWTGQTFTNYRCWYITVFPSTLLIVVSIISLMVIITVCVLYFLILHRAVKTVDEIRAFKETNHKIAYINKAFHAAEDCKRYDEVSETTVTITLSTDTLSGESCSEIEMRELNNINFGNKWCKQIKKKIVKMSRITRKDNPVLNNPSKLKAVKTVILVTACFVGTWAPYYVAIIMYVRCNMQENGYACLPIETLTLGPLYFLGVSNSLCDPLIYAWWHSGFKRTLKKIYWKYAWRMKVFRFRNKWFN